MEIIATEANQCDLRCPHKSYLRGEFDEARNNHPLKLPVTLARSLGQVARAWAVCPQRKLTKEMWEANPTCIATTLKKQAENPINLTDLPEYDRRILEPYIDPDSSNDSNK